MAKLGCLCVRPENQIHFSMVTPHPQCQNSAGNLAENTPKCPKIYQAQFLAKAQKFGLSLINGFIGLLKPENIRLFKALKSFRFLRLFNTKLRELHIQHLMIK